MEVIRYKMDCKPIAFGILRGPLLVNMMEGEGEHLNLLRSDRALRIEWVDTA